MTNLPELLPCPFCGTAPNVSLELPKGGGDTSWVFISCHACRAKPHVGEGRTYFYHERNERVVFQTPDQALQKAVDHAAREWNRRIQ